MQEEEKRKQRERSSSILPFPTSRKWPRSPTKEVQGARLIAFPAVKVTKELLKPPETTLKASVQPDLQLKGWNTLRKENICSENLYKILEVDTFKETFYPCQVLWGDQGTRLKTEALRGIPEE